MANLKFTWKVKALAVILSSALLFGMADAAFIEAFAASGDDTAICDTQLPEKADDTTEKVDDTTEKDDDTTEKADDTTEKDDDTTEKTADTAFTFENIQPSAINYGDNGNKYSNKAFTSNGENAVISYEIVSGEDVASVDAATGELTIKKAGTVAVKAVRAEDDKYQKTEISYSLVVNKAEQTGLNFVTTQPPDLIYGENENKYTNTAFGGEGSGAITYEITEGADTADINPESGEVSIKKAGKVTVTATKAEDDSYNACSGTYELTISYLDAPQIPYLLNGDVVSENVSGWYTGDVTISAPDGYLISYSNALQQNEWSESVTYNKEGINSFFVYLKEIEGGGITDAIAVKDLKIDNTNPVDLEINYHENLIGKFREAFGFYQNPVKVTIRAKDSISGIQSFVYRYETSTYSISNQGKSDTVVTAADENFEKNDDGSVAYTFEIPAQFRGNVSFSAMDAAGRISEYKDKNTIVVDDKNPNVTITYEAAGTNALTGETASLKGKVEKDTDTITRKNVTDADGNTRFVYNGAVLAKVQVEEANFFEEDISVIVKRDGEEVSGDCVSGWTADEENDRESCAILLEEDGDYEIMIKYTDNSGNVMIYSSDEFTGKTGTECYISNIITVDTAKPVIDVTYSAGTPKNGNYYNTDRIAVINITDCNFRPDEVEVSVSAADIQGNTISFQYSGLKSWDDWTQSTEDEYTWTAVIPFTVNAVYIFHIAYADIAGNQADEYTADYFIVDKQAPDIGKMEISYSDGLNTWTKIRNGITFGYFAYQDAVTVTLTSEDDISGIDYLTWSYMQEADTGTGKNAAEITQTIKRNKITFSENGKTAAASFSLSASQAETFRGSIAFTATDMAGNISDIKTDGSRITIVDNISPTRRVSYSPAKQVLDAATLKTKTSYTYEAEGTDSILYYDGDVTAAFQITEDNFYAEDVDIRVNGVKKVPTDWKREGNIWTGTIILSGDGDYLVTMEYADRSTNKMSSYTSEKIVIDTIDPVVDVVYGNSDVKNTVGERQYFDRTQTAVISITEHNFRADDVTAVVTAKDVTGADVPVMDYAGYLSDRNNWTKDGDKYTAIITYGSDANYTFDMDYADLALNKMADYEEEQFTVDTTPPANLRAVYSTSIFEKIMEAVTFGYYNAQMTVTIQADEDTTGVEHFVYSYIKSSGSGSVNAELLDDVIQNTAISQEGKTFTATFNIPKYVLQNDNQFNGTITFIACDYSGNSQDKSDGKRIVVDNIAPAAIVTYNEPIRESNGISYYAGDINAAVIINEANFYAEDVAVTVSKDGNPPVAVSTNWDNDSADVHTGTFSLHEDGDYVVTINYTDRSANQMEQYSSQQLTIDTAAPVISVSEIKANSANKDEVYGFTITASDSSDNLDAGTFQPVLTAVTRAENGAYEVKEIPLTDVSVVEMNQTYAVTVENLTEDAVYTLSCSVKDMADNESHMISLEDGSEYETVSFSINRNGSAFIADHHTESLISQYYVYGVENDVVIDEINVDIIENYTVKMNGAELEEGRDYTTTVSVGDGEWSKRTYDVKKRLFEDEGEYDIVVESVDKTDTAAYSDVKNLKISFVVDRTAPAVTISGLENNGRYQKEVQTVTAIPADDGGKLRSFRAVVMDKNGKLLRDEKGRDISTRIDLKGEKLDTYLAKNDGKVTFTVPEGLESQVQIICDDYAMHSDGTTTNTYDETFTKVTVSPSNLIIFYANKPLFYVTVIGIGVISAGVIIIIAALRGRKKHKKET